MVDLITNVSRDELKKFNKVKGVCLQKIIKHHFNFTDEDISMKKVILNTLSEKIKDYFIIIKPFKLNDVYYRIKYDFLSIDKFDKEINLFVLDKKQRWKVCNKCGQFIINKPTNTKKCFKKINGVTCFGKFVFIKDKLKKHPYKEIKENKLKYLLDEGYLKKVNFNLRCDFFSFKDGVFEVFESKNKEITGLTKGDVVSSLIYANILSKTNHNVNSLNIIFNGGFDTHLQEYINNLQKKLSFKITLKHIFNINDLTGVTATNIKGKWNYILNDEFKINIIEKV